MANIAKLPLFCRCVIQNFPFIEEDFDALTNYELICKVVEYLNKVITSQNEVIDVANSLSESFQQLHDYVANYFDNLDVQEEINNKLDAMVEDGTLQEIITSYIQSNVAWTFDTVSDMKQATNLINGSYARTIGYYNVNDDGGSLYYISDTGTADEGATIAIGDNLYAHLVVGSSVNVEQFGAKGDGTSNDQDAINLAIQSSASTIRFNGKTYAIKGYEDGQPEGGTTGLTGTTGVVLASNKIIDLNCSIIKIIPNNRQNYNGFTLVNVHDITIKNGTIFGDVSTHTDAGGEWGYGISLRLAKNIVLENLICTKCWGDGINLNNNGTPNADYNTNILISNCICDDNRRQGMSIENGKNIIVENSQFINTGDTHSTSPASGVDVEPNYDTVDGIEFINCKFNKNSNQGLLVQGSNVSNVLVQLCEVLENLHSGLGVMSVAGNNIVIDGCKVNNGNVRIRPTNNILIKNNEFTDCTLETSGANAAAGTTFTFENNLFKNSQASSSKSIITTWDSPTNGNFKAIITDNKFYNTSGNDLTNIRSWLSIATSNGFVFADCERNYFQGGKVGGYFICDAVIKNNTFVKQYEQAIYIPTNPYKDTIIENNIFEQNNISGGVTCIYNQSAANGIVCRNNDAYTHCLDRSIDNATPAHETTRFLYNDTLTGDIAIVEDNNIIDNARTE